MSTAIRVALAALAMTLVFPELTRYRGERRLRHFDGIQQLAAAQPEQAAQRSVALRKITRQTLEVRTYPGDWRPAAIAAGILLRTGDAPGAAALYRQASAFGERPELDANLALALRAAGDSARAEELLFRAIWLSPALANLLPAADAHWKVKVAEHKLNHGALNEYELPPAP